MAHACLMCGDVSEGRLQVAFSSGSTIYEYCANPGCKTFWEALPQDLETTDRGHFATFDEPCDNCAFRPGSPEQRDREGWKTLLDKLNHQGHAFYCHKGMPIQEHGEGFYFPEADGKPDVQRMRMCRGYLNMRLQNLLKEATL